jgi:CPA1 family monovalent cation:H+ antiporter
MHHDTVVTAVIAIVGLLLVAVAAAIGLKRTNLPYTVGLVIVGIAIGTLSDSFHWFGPLTELTLSPEIILFVFLPTLIFESAFNLDSRLLAKNLAPVLTLAAPGLLISTGIVGALLAWLTPLSLGPALLFGALASATDPVAVIALFKEVGAPKRLTILVEGESLFNDATAIVLFGIILSVLSGGAFTAATLGDGVIEFFVVFLGGIAVGAVIGYLMIRSIALADDDPLVEVALSTVVAYAAFIVADHYLHVSGVMATVGAGLVIGTIGSTRFVPEVRHYLHQFWEYAGFVANSLIFLMVGITVKLGVLAEHIQPVLWTIVVALVARALVVFGLIPVVNRVPGVEPIARRMQAVLYWGGLRGAVALALVLSLPESFPQRDLLIAMAVGLVLFTLLTGGPTMAPLIKALELAKPSVFEQIAHQQAALAAKAEAVEQLQKLGTSSHFSSRLVADLSDEYTDRVTTIEAELRELRTSSSPSELKRTVWSEALTIERHAYRELFERGVISEPVFRELELSVDLRRDHLKGADTPGEMVAAQPIEVRVTAWLFTVLGRVAPRSKLVRRHRLRALAAEYEHETAVLSAAKRVVEQIRGLSELSGIDPALADECRNWYAAVSERAMASIDGIAEHFPEYVEAVQRQTARRIALDAEADAITHLARGGGIPETVARDARKAVEVEQRRLQRRPVAAREPSPEELLARVPFFQGLSESDFARVVDALVPRTILPDEHIIRQGERGTSLFLISRGVVAVVVALPGEKPKRVAALHAGEFFGEMALLTNDPRTATVQAVTACQLYELSSKDVDGICEHCPGVREALVRAYQERRGGRRSSVVS